jgi:hypothetical protein
VHLAAPPLGCTGADYVTEERRADKVGDDEEQRLCFKALQYSHKTDNDCPFHQDCTRNLPAPCRAFSCGIEQTSLSVRKPRSSTQS